MQKVKALVSKLLWKSKSKWQIAGAAFGGFIGLTMLLFALQTWQDIQYLMHGNKAADEYVTINKKVGLLNLLGTRASFSEEEVDVIRNKPFIQSCGAYTPNRFKVSARSRSINFYTELFFESVPESFLDINTASFQWSPGEKVLPIVMSKDYLSLYNFGFAISQGLPQLTPATIRQVSLEVTIFGRGKAETFQGRIVGFSDRINSVLAPVDFINWANDNYGEGTAEVSRMILLVNNPGNPAFGQFLEDNNYEISGGRLIGSRTAVLLQTLVGVIAFIGAIIVILSVLIFILNFQLLISQSAADIRLLLQLGYKHQFLSLFLIKRWIVLFGIIAIMVMGMLMISRKYITEYFQNQGIDLLPQTDPLVFIAAAVIIPGIVLINALNIRNSVLRLFS